MNSNSPIAVFDSGVGSYSIVKVLQKRLPNESIIYLADRASFPYGNKSHEELKNIIKRTINWLEIKYDPKIIIIASNTPSIQVLNEIKNHKTKIIGTYPPIEKAVNLSQSKHIAILGTKGAVLSSEIDGFIKSKNLPAEVVIHKVNASDLVGLVEPGIFQTNKSKTQEVIKTILDPVINKDPSIDVMTLSSTHLPFLYDDLIMQYPQISFIDPADEVISEVNTYLVNSNLESQNSESIKVLTTIDHEKKLHPGDLQKILETLGLKSQIDVVSVWKRI